MQRTQIIGNLTADPEHKATPSGTELATFTVAVNEKRGEKDDATFYNCTAWEKKAAPILTYLHKGDKVYVEGKVKARAYQAKDGSSRASLDLTVGSCEFLNVKRTNANEKEQKSDGRMIIVEDEEVPF